MWSSDDHDHSKYYIIIFIIVYILMLTLRWSIFGRIFGVCVRNRTSEAEEKRKTMIRIRFYTERLLGGLTITLIVNCLFWKPFWKIVDCRFWEPFTQRTILHLSCYFPVILWSLLFSSVQISKKIQSEDILGYPGLNYY